MRWVSFVGVAWLLCGCAPDDARLSSSADRASATLSSREQALIFAADGAAQHGDITAAERDYRSAMALSKGRIDAHLALAQLYIHNRDYEKTRDVLQQALELQFEDPLANYLMGKLSIDTGEYEKAGEAFQRGLITKPGDLDLSIGLAVSKDMRGLHDEAQKIYQRALEQNANADLTNLRTDLAMSYLLSNQAQRAIELLKEDADKPNVSSVTRHNLALAYGLVGRDSEAKQLLHGEVSEETRLQGLQRLKSYLSKQTASVTPPPSAEVIVTDKPALAKPQKKKNTKKPDLRPAPADAIPDDISSTFLK